MNSVFHKLVSTENDFTQLLFNLMRHSDDFRASVLELLLKGSHTAGISPEQIRIQTDIAEDGRPDIVVSSGDLYAFIEVKVDEHCGLTTNQKINPISNGYLRHLLSQKNKRDRKFIFLVPGQWYYLDELKDSIKRFPGDNEENVQIRIEYWEEILKVSNSINDPLVKEFGKLLADRYEPVAFTAEELNMLFSAQFVDAFKSIRNLQMMISQIKKKSENCGYGCRIEEKSIDEYGIYIFDKTNPERWLWFGVWMPFSEKHELPICFGIDYTKSSEMKSILESVCPGATKDCDGWTMGWITKDAFETNDHVQTIWKKLQPVLNAVLGKAKGASAI
jgi:hypothetical protein